MVVTFRRHSAKVCHSNYDDDSGNFKPPLSSEESTAPAHVTYSIHGDDRFSYIVVTMTNKMNSVNDIVWNLLETPLNRLR